VVSSVVVIPRPFLRREEVLDRRAEEAREREGQRQGGQVPPLLDGVDRLPRHADRLAQRALRQVAGAVSVLRQMPVNHAL
jgi:hypothetical protein